ncbi:MAG: 4Fe-4S cluster-binding domain-containing protein, partial [Bacteriovoracaceae bacterium]
MEKFQIHSIYRATEGEGIHIGNPLIFVRFQGCAVGCLNCDSKETWDFHPEKTLSKEFVIKKVKELAGSGIKRLTLTGGDPLHPKLINEVKYLAREFKALGFWVNLEAAGTRVEEELFKICDFISYDLKTPSTGVRTSWDLAVSAIEKFWNKIQIKAVIENKKDFEYYQEFQTLLLRSLEPNIYLK